MGTNQRIHRYRMIKTTQPAETISQNESMKMWSERYSKSVAIGPDCDEQIVKTQTPTE
jgi:hypothetical protein